jgi:hypothetical protein
LSELDAGVDGVEAGALAAGAVELESDDGLLLVSDEELLLSPDDFGLALP